MRIIYLDHNATTPLLHMVRAAMEPYLTDRFGNPSSIHQYGQEARAAVDIAREKVASTIGAQPDEICFVSSGTEADNWALRGILEANRDKGNHIITSQIEHHAILHCCKWLERNGYADVTYVPVTAKGWVDPDAVSSAIRPSTILISIMAVNNETGVIQPIEEIGEIAKQHHIYFHSDAVQALGKIAVNTEQVGLDLISFSAHKVYGPKGIGALYVRKGTKVTPLFFGGNQERGLRSSTENVPSIVGFSRACVLINPGEMQRLTEWRNQFEARVLEKINGAQIIGDPMRRVGNTTALSFKDIRADALIMQLDQEGILVSSGSACASGAAEPSHILQAMGLPREQSLSVVRFSFGRLNREDDVDYVIAKLAALVQRLRETSSS